MGEHSTTLGYVIAKAQVEFIIAFLLALLDLNCAVLSEGRIA